MRSAVFFPYNYVITHDLISLYVQDLCPYTAYFPAEKKNSFQFSQKNRRDPLSGFYRTILLSLEYAFRRRDPRHSEIFFTGSPQRTGKSLLGFGFDDGILSPAVSESGNGQEINRTNCERISCAKGKTIVS